MDLQTLIKAGKIQTKIERLRADSEKLKKLHKMMGEGIHVKLCSFDGPFVEQKLSPSDPSDIYIMLRCFIKDQLISELQWEIDLRQKEFDEL